MNDRGHTLHEFGQVWQSNKLSRWRMRPAIFLFVTCLVAACGAAHGAGTIVRTEANVPIEMILIAQRQYADPFNKVQVDVLFTDPTGAQKLVPAFWGGGKIWKVRYASPLTGKHRWQAQSTESDLGLNGPRGTIQITRYRGENPLFKHGPLVVAPDQRHLQHADGTRFFWLGDTWWMGLCHRLRWPDEFAQLAADRKQKGFSVIQLVAGLYPDMPPFDPRGANEAGFPWEVNYTNIRPPYFDAADVRLRYLIEQGFTPCIVGAWGYFLPWMGEQRMGQHWRELIARYGSWPVVWCVTGEANLPWYLVKGFPYQDAEQVRRWTEVARYVRAADPFHRLMTIHPTAIGKQNARNAILDSTLLDFDFLQTDHGQGEVVADTVRLFTNAYHSAPPMPVVNGEASYEMLNNQITARWVRAFYWLCMINGAAGHTYGANGIWQCNRPDQPHGNSPTGGSYGTMPWNEAMHLPGSQQFGDGKKFLEQFSWERCVPQPETVVWAGTRTNHWGDWIWFPEGEPREDAPVAVRFFRRSFDLRGKGRVQSATLRIAADDRATIWLNGKNLGDAKNYHAPEEFEIADLLRRRGNLLAVQAENLLHEGKANPAALMAILEIQFSDGSSQTLVSDSEWRASQEAADRWQEGAFDDSSWPNARKLADYGDAPWGVSTDEAPEYMPPYAMGIADELRLIYCIAPRPLRVNGLRPKARFRVTHFDPVTGQSQPATSVTTDSGGQLSLPAPAHHHDWVVALELNRP